MLTYNKKLKDEVRDKVKKLDIKHLKVHNYNSLYKKFRSSSMLLLVLATENP